MFGPDIWIVWCRECGERGSYENHRPDNPTAQAWKDVKHKDGCGSSGATYKQACDGNLFKHSVLMS